jgi:uncharacterized RDD family membrane protein YckC
MKTVRKSYLLINYMIDFTVYAIVLGIFEDVTNITFSRLSSLLFFFLYYFIFEVSIQRTPGKMITKTCVVGMNNNKPKLKAIALRSACRLIFLNEISFLFGTYGIHDGYSKTRLIRKE